MLGTQHELWYSLTVTNYNDTIFEVSDDGGQVEFEIMRSGDEYNEPVNMTTCLSPIEACELADRLVHYAEEAKRNSEKVNHD